MLKHMQDSYGKEGREGTQKDGRKCQDELAVNRIKILMSPLHWSNSKWFPHNRTLTEIIFTYPAGSK